MEKSFGNLIRKARKDKGYSQRELAKHLGVDFTYLSKLENDHADYAPKEEVIRRLAKNLNLNPEELIFLAGRIPQQYEEILKQNPREMLVLFQRMQENPEFAQEISQATRENEQ
ncbi:MAG: helix-turn-helix domain-containing protein [Trichodesmium sp. MAG_R03]|nr:helix-turn-helix domain-containing protein [Trichodesmium sp. MAG_R03]